MNSPALILASSSSRRQQLLDQLGIVYSVCEHNIQESPKTDESPEDLVLRLAIEKAEAGLKQQSADNVLILGSEVSSPTSANSSRKPILWPSMVYG